MSVRVLQGSVSCVAACKQCAKPIKRRGRKRAVFCSVECKGRWQQTQKPVDEAWLHQKYVVEGLSTYEIAAIVERNPKQVWHWLRGYGLELRGRGGDRAWSTRPDPGKPYQNPGWLWTHYFFMGRSTPEIAEEFGVCHQTINHFLRKAGIPRRTVSEARAIKHWGNCGEDNSMFGKRGPLHPNWKGGCTTEREAFYSTIEWRLAFREVWRRDRKRCRRCDATYIKGAKLEVHHIIPFAVKELRAVVSNLVLLCQQCHDWVHGRANVNGDFLKGG